MESKKQQVGKYTEIEQINIFVLILSFSAYFNSLHAASVQ
jgi:hypothetical protein